MRHANAMVVWAAARDARRREERRRDACLGHRHVQVLPAGRREHAVEQRAKRRKVGAVQDDARAAAYVAVHTRLVAIVTEQLRLAPLFKVN